MKPWDDFINKSTNMFGKTNTFGRTEFDTLGNKIKPPTPTEFKGESALTGPTVKKLHKQIARQRGVSPKEVSPEEVYGKMGLKWSQI